MSDKFLTAIHFYYCEEYATRIKLETREIRGVALNIKNKTFSPFELRSLRSVEVILLPKNTEEYASADALRKEMNKYGVVSLLKKPYDQHQPPMTKRCVL